MSKDVLLGGDGHLTLSDGWRLASSAPGGERPAEGSPQWCAVTVPGTVVSAICRDWADAERKSQELESRDWVYRCALPEVRREGPAECWLHIGRLVPVADVYLGDRLLLRSENAFLRHAVLLEAPPEKGEPLTIVCRSWASLLAQRRPRPRWKTPMVDHQGMRFVRAPLLGHMRGWTPPVPMIGVLDPVVLERRSLLSLRRVSVDTKLHGSVGWVHVEVAARILGDASVFGAVLRVGAHSSPLEHQLNGDGEFEVRGSLKLPAVEPWWPHTHGRQPRYPACIALQTSKGESVIDLDPLAFRSVRVAGADAFAIEINGVQVFCRGACWMPIDLWSMVNEPGALRRTLDRVKAAGMNMLRVSGATLYESREFYAACDELGILVWQDLMFSSMDYPTEDPSFASNVEREVRQTAAELRAHPCIVMVCGNSEVEQQAAMMGLPSSTWSSRFFEEQVREWCHEALPDVPYWPSTPHGGALPFSSRTGTAHWYAVGNFMRPLDEARRSEPVFATECLGFANLPDDSKFSQFLCAGQLPPHHPAWKARVPRDIGPGHDFDDVRDHYLKLLYGVDPVDLRRQDIERYLDLSRVVTGDVMTAVLSEWRRAGARCTGAILWMLKDLWPGAGWGVLDSDGDPKAAYFALKRVMRSPNLLLTDEACDGLDAHLVNDGASELRAVVEVRLLRDGATVVSSASTEASLPPRSVTRLGVGDVLGGFCDVSYAYRFGPPGHDTVIVSLRDVASGELWAEAIYYPLGRNRIRELDVGLSARLELVGSDQGRLVLHTRRLACAVAIQSDDFVPADNYFDLPPGAERVIMLEQRSGRAMAAGTIRALNSRAVARFTSDAR